MNYKVTKLIYSLLLCIATITAAQAVDFASLDSAIARDGNTTKYPPVFRSDGNGYLPSAGISRDGEQNPGLRATSNAVLVGFQNGGFETGDFTGWVAADNGLQAFYPWQVQGAGPGPAGFSTNPIQGTFDAVNGFDGAAGYEAWLSQDVVVPNNVFLSLYDRIQYDSLEITSTLPRIYEIQIRDLDDNLLEVLHHQEVMLNGQPYTDLGWQHRIFDISQYAGQAVRVFIHLFVPEDHTGPASIEFDDFRFITRYFQNGGFETGDFTRWVAADNGLEAFYPWQVQGAGIGTFEYFTTNPIQGTFDAVNGFDGAAGYEAWLSQDVVVPNNVFLSLYDRIQYDGLDESSTLPRIYEIQIRDLDDNLLEVLHHQEVMLNGQPYTDLGWQHRIFDISQYAGQAVRVFIHLFVPEDFTGPASIEFDDFRITPLVADFSAAPTKGFAPLTVNFTDQSAGYLTSWSWDFGDGSTSAERNPVHVYNEPGSYNVSLTATGPGGSDTLTKTKYIFVRIKAMPWIQLLLGD